MIFGLIHRDEIELVPESLIFSGHPELPQFSVTKVATAKIERTLKRKIAYHVISVYLPSSTIFVIPMITM